jgi:carboxypeptidase C (cathepsin A)
MTFKPLTALAALSIAPWTLAATILAAADEKPEATESPRFLKDESQVSQGTITVGGHPLVYQAEAGLLVVHVKDPMDDDPPQPGEQKGAPAKQTPEASMSYVAYFKGDHEDPRRPITFLFNGGPGSSTVWLHMGAFGPKRVITSDDTHSPAAPYRIVDNQFTLLDVSDLVFVDAPGTGFGHLRGTDKEKAFFGVDADAHAFASFVVEFLSRHARWNSPKYMFGESYGTTRAAVLAYVLQDERSLDFNGIILLSQILSFDNSADGPQLNPGIDQPYVLVLPTYAASAWYHHKLPNRPPTLGPHLAEAERFATNDYAQALAAGAALAPERMAEIAAKIHELTGLPADYVARANLRVNAGEFEKTLQGADVTTGRLDSRFSGPTIDPMSKEADYDPQSAAISSAYVSAFNDYVRRTLRFGDKKTYKASIQAWKTWDYAHRPPGSSDAFPSSLNVMLDLARAMQENPNLKVQMNGGYYDLATPYFSAAYELRHLPMQASLQSNIETHFYESGHMVYAHEPSLEALHANVAAFIAKTRGATAP